MEEVETSSLGRIVVPFPFLAVAYRYWDARLSIFADSLPLSMAAAIARIGFFLVGSPSALAVDDRSLPNMDEPMLVDANSRGGGGCDGFLLP